MSQVERELFDAAVSELRQRLPAGWRVDVESDEPISNSAASLQVGAPNQSPGALVLILRPRLEPRDAIRLAESVPTTATSSSVVVASFLSPSTRARLSQFQLGYLDLTGNARIVLSRPGLFIQSEGATEDPNPAQGPARTLRGAKVARIVRALVDYAQPFGIRELAAATGINAGHVSRIVRLLDREGLITRGRSGRVEPVDWSALLRLWALRAPLSSRGTAFHCFEQAGIDALVQRLARSDETYAITAGRAAAVYAPVAPTPELTLWIRDAREAVRRLSLSDTEGASNVTLLEPADLSVFDGEVRLGGNVVVAPSQAAADLLTSPGRAPAKGEVLMRWMRANEALWRR